MIALTHGMRGQGCAMLLRQIDTILRLCKANVSFGIERVLEFLTLHYAHSCDLVIAFSDELVPHQSRSALISCLTSLIASRYNVDITK